MKITKNKRKDFTVSLEIEETHEVFEECMEKAFHKVKKHAKIAGFRKGKITRKLFEKNYGTGMLIEEGIQLLVNDAYFKAIQEADLKVVDYPKNIDIDQYKEDKPVKFRCDVDVEPIIKLGKYKGLKIKKDDKIISEEDVDMEVKKLQENHAEYKEAQRPSEKDDIIKLKMSAKIDDNEYEPWTKNEIGTRIGIAQFGEKCDEQLIGLKKDDKKSFVVAYEAEDKITEVAGKSVQFDIEVIENRAKELPELTEEFIEKATGEKRSKDDFIKKIRENLENDVKKDNELKLKNAIIDAAVEEVKVEIPEAMVSSEVDYSIRQLETNLGGSGLTMDQYLSISQKTRDDLKADLKESAEKRVKTSLVIQAIIDKESVEASNEEVESKLKEWNIPDVNTVDDILKNPQYNIDSIKRAIAEEKVTDLLVSTAKVK